MVDNPSLKEQLQQLEAQVQFIEAQASMFDSRLAAAPADERAAMPQEEQLLQHQLIALREQLATLQQQDRMQQAVPDVPPGPVRTGRFYMMLRCLLTVAALALCYYELRRLRRNGRLDAFSQVFGSFQTWKMIGDCMKLDGPAEWIVMLIEWALRISGYHHLTFW